MRPPPFRTGLVLTSLAVLAGCSAHSSSPGSLTGTAMLPGMQSLLSKDAKHHGGPSSQIQHIVLVIQENRSFNDLFMTYPGATTVTKGYEHTGKKINLKPVELQQHADVVHNLSAFLAACDGSGSIPGTNCKMDGFDEEAPNAPTAPYAYVPKSQTAPYWQMAQNYVLDDMMFPSHIDSSFTAHQYLIAAQSGSSVNDPSGPWGCNGGSNDLVGVLGQNRTITGTEEPCFDYQTLGDELDNSSPPLTWRFYAPGIGKGCKPKQHSQQGGYWSAYRAVEHICEGPDWAKDVISPQTQFLTDVAGGTLENVTWVVPSLADSDHPGSHSDAGPSWVTSVVNAVGESQFWDTTLIIVVWDDWGGQYDSVPPPYKDYDGDGIRVASICISPYAYQGVVDHTMYEFGSIDRMIENTFGLATLAASDARATPVNSGCINPSQSTPRAFQPIGSPYNRNHFLREPPSAQPPDTDF